MSTKLPDATDLEETKDMGYQQAGVHDAEKSKLVQSPTQTQIVLGLRRITDPQRDSVTPPKGCCNFAVTVTFIKLH